MNPPLQGFFHQGETKPKQALFNDCLVQAYNPPEKHGSSSEASTLQQSSPFSHLIGQEMAQTTLLVDKFSMSSYWSIWPKTCDVIGLWSNT